MAPAFSPDSRVVTQATRKDFVDLLLSKEWKQGTDTLAIANLKNWDHQGLVGLTKSLAATGAVECEGVTRIYQI